MASRSSSLGPLATSVAEFLAWRESFVGPPRKPAKRLTFAYPGLTALLSGSNGPAPSLAPAAGRKAPQVPPPLASNQVGDILTPKQAAAYLQIPVSTLAVWRCTNRVYLPFFKIGGAVRYRRADLDAHASPAEGLSIDTAQIQLGRQALGRRQRA